MKVGILLNEIHRYRYILLELSVPALNPEDSGSLSHPGALGKSNWVGTHAPFIVPFLQGAGLGWSHHQGHRALNYLR